MAPFCSLCIRTTCEYCYVCYSTRMCHTALYHRDMLQHQLGILPDSLLIWLVHLQMPLSLARRKINSSNDSVRERFKKSEVITRGLVLQRPYSVYYSNLISSVSPLHAYICDTHWVDDVIWNSSKIVHFSPLWRHLGSSQVTQSAGDF